MADDDQAFATISVNGLSFTVNFYETGITEPVWSHTFSKVNTPPTISDITDKTTNEDTATGAIPFTVGDVELNPAYLTVTATSSTCTLVPDWEHFAGRQRRKPHDRHPARSQPERHRHHHRLGE